MIVLIESNNQTYKIDGGKPLDVSIPLDFNGVQPNAYGVEKAESKPCEAEGIVGDTRRGGSCNFEQVKFIPHCNGTHTESVGHITNERIAIRDCLKDIFVLATLISVAPEDVSETSESYAVEVDENDKLITKNSILNALDKVFNTENFIHTTTDKELNTPNKELSIPNRDLNASNKELSAVDKELNISNQEVEIAKFDALIVRTIPNDESKLSKTYLKEIPSFFSTEAMQFICQLGIKHLLVDLPSIDRLFDEGKLSNHRIFWNVAQGSFETNGQTLTNNTITELIYVANEIEDGTYLLNLQIPSFVADAAPSRPLLFKIIK